MILTKKTVNLVLGDKMKKFTILIVFYLIFINTYASTYRDTDRHWAKDSIDYVTNENIMVGYPNKTFDPDKFVKRSEAVMILTKLTQAQDGEVPIHFLDVSERDWFYRSIKSAVNLGYITDSNFFKPQEFMNRRDFAIMFSKAFMNSGEVIQYSDIGFMDDELKEALKLLPGFFSGYKDRSFRGERYISRGEVATLCKKVLKEGYLKRKVKPIETVGIITEDEKSKSFITEATENQRKKLKYLIENYNYLRNEDENMKRLLSKAEDIANRNDLSEMIAIEKEIDNYILRNTKRDEFYLNVDVYSEDGKPIYGATLTINQNPFVNKSTLKNGKYLLNVNYNGYKSEKTFVEIDGRDKNVTIIMKKESNEMARIEVIGKYARVERDMVKIGERYTVKLNPPAGVELKKFVVNGAEKNVDFINDSFTGVATKDVQILVEWNE